MTHLDSHIWRFVPVARVDDPTWQGRRIWAELEIVAATAGQAILLASRFDEAEAGRSTATSQDGQQLRSGFEDERLYHLARTAAPSPPAASPGQIIRARRLASDDPGPRT
jgi:hypothetical protein